MSIPTTATDKKGRHLLQVAIDSGHHELIPILAAHPLVPKDIICVYHFNNLERIGEYPILFYVQTDISKHKLEIEDFKELVSHCKKSQIDTRHLMPKTSSTATDGMTALHFALISGRIAHAEVLIAAGANKKALVGDTFATFCDYRKMTLQQIATKECSMLDGYQKLMEHLNRVLEVELIH